MQGPLGETLDAMDKGRLFLRAREHFIKADHVRRLYQTSSGSIDVPRLARTILDDQSCEAIGIQRLTRKVLVLAAIIELRKQQTSMYQGESEEFKRIERELMNWGTRWSSLTIGQMDEVEIFFSFLGIILHYCDPSHWPPNLVADMASEDTRWGINNTRLRGDLIIQKYVRKWQLGWKRFLPWYGSASGERGQDWLQRAAEAGHVIAQRQLANCYALGEGFAQNDQLAACWYRKAAEQGDKIAQRIFGYYCANGKGVAKNRPEAVKWYQAAAENGDAQAQYNLGCCFYHGQGVELDFTEAAKWFGKAVEQGHASAQGNLGLCYYEGHGVPQNYSRAVEFYQMAADQGYAEAQYNLATCYCDGLGVNKDNVEAYKWLYLIPIGKLFGRLECARELKDELARKMTPDEIAEARRRADSFRAVKH